MRLRLTKQGRGAVLACILVAAAAANTANNLLYLLLAILIALYPVSAWLARRSLRAVSAQLLAPTEVRAGAPVDAAARLRNPEDGQGAPGVVAELLGAGAAAEVVPFLPRGGSVTLSFPFSFPRRGVQRLRLLLRSPFPFGILDAVKGAGEEEVLVLPRPAPDWREPPQMGEASGDEPSRRPGLGVDLLDIRDYRPGEDARAIDWKATARLERPMVRVFAREEERRAALVVDPSFPKGLPQAAAEDAVEEAISRAAGAAEDLSQRGWRLRVVTPGSGSEGGALEIQRNLARLEYVEEPLTDGWWSRSLAPGEPFLLFRASAESEREPGGAA
jgi:uncharacterized protein (DUF58 family)